MIPVEPAPEPATFHDAVTVPGLRAIAEMVGKKPPYRRAKGKPYSQRKRAVRKPDGSTIEELITREVDLPSSEFHPYWTAALDDLMAAYDEVCAYSCFRIHRITGAQSVDHFAPRSRAWDRVYTWSNYRLACSRLNARKRDFTDVLDPFEVRTGWFRLELVGFQVLPGLSLRGDVAQRVRDTIERLGLGDADMRGAREEHAERYWCGEVSLRVLQEESPFVAFELARQERLNPGDVWT